MSGHRSRRSPRRAAVDVELHQLDRTVTSQLADHRESGYDHANADHDAVVGTARDELRKFVELRGEGLDDAKQVEDLEVVRRRLASGTTLNTELAIQVLNSR